MTATRRRIAFLIPPGNPNIEPEIIRLTPPDVTVHFTRMNAGGATGSLDGQEERNRSQIAHLEEDVALLALVRPAVIVLAHTATSYTLGQAGEAALTAKMHALTGIPFITAFASVVQALAHLGVQRIALGAPYSQAWTERSKAHLEAHCLQVVSFGRLEGVTNIYDETPARARDLARQVDVAEAQAVFLSGVGLPTIEVLGELEAELGKPVISSASAMMWNALRIAAVDSPVDRFGALASMPGGSACS